MLSYKKAVAAAAVTALFAVWNPHSAKACACGCGVFSVSTPQMFPKGSGGTLSLEWDYMNQDQNWRGSSRAPSANNSDKRIRSDFYSARLQYMVNRTWGFNVEVPYWSRSFDTDVGGGDVEAYNHAAPGDIRLMGMYTGFSADMSTGLTFGVKLPTGSHTLSGMDRDTQIGTGSTDALLGVFHRDRFAAHPHYMWSVDGKLDVPVLTVGGYRPGAEFDASTGVSHDPFSLGHGVKIAPFLQLVNSYRLHDSGAAADPANTGYERLLVTPGLEFGYGAETLDADVGLPVYQNVRGNQLVAPVLFQVVLSHAF